MPDASITSPTPARLTAIRRGARRGALSLFLSVLLTYLRRPFLWCWPLGNALLCAFAASRIGPTELMSTAARSEVDPLSFDIVFFSGFLLACAVGFFAASVTGHYVQILRPPRGHVVPHLRGAALLAASVLTAAILLGGVALWPHPDVKLWTGAVEPRAVRIPTHALALAVILAAQLAWTQVTPILGAASIFAWGLLGFPQVRAATLRVLIGQAPALEWAAALTGVGLFAALWTCIARRRDRTAAVDPAFEWLAGKIVGRESRIPADAAPAAPTTIPAIAPPRPFTAASRRRLHRRALAGGTAPLTVGLATGLALVALVYLLRFFSVERMDAMTPRILLYMVSILPAIVVCASAIENRGALITHGLLLPQRRRQYVRDVGLAMLANLLTAWAAGVVPLLFLILLDVPDRVRPTPALLVAMLSIAAAYQVFALGVIAWLLRLNHRIVITIVQAAGCAMAVPIIAVPPNGMLSAVTLVTTAAFVAIGVGFALTAYYRWSDSELPSAGPSKTAAAL